MVARDRKFENFSNRSETLRPCWRRGGHRTNRWRERKEDRIVEETLDWKLRGKGMLAECIIEIQSPLSCFSPSLWKRELFAPPGARRCDSLAECGSFSARKEKGKERGGEKISGIKKDPRILWRD